MESIPPRSNSSSRRTSGAATPTRSRTASRPTTPSLSLLPPTLRPVASFTTLRSQRPGRDSPALAGLTASALPPHLSLPAPTNPEHVDIESSNSSLFNVSFEGTGEGILLKDEPETGDGEDGTAIGRHVDGSVDEEARKNLREQLKRTLTRRRESSIDTVVPVRAAEVDEMASQPEQIEANLPDPIEPRQYFVLTDAGKPVFASSPLANEYDNLASTAGLMQALLSVFIDDGDKLRYINAGRTRISFLLRSPLYYACVSSWGEPESVEDKVAS